MGFDLFVAGIGNNLFMQLKFWMRIGFFFFFLNALRLKKFLFAPLDVSPVKFWV